MCLVVGWRTIGVALPRRSCDLLLVRPGSFEHAAGDGWWLAAGEEPAGQGSGGGNAEDGDGEVEDGRVAENARVAAVSGGQCEVGAGRADQRAEQGERTGGGRGESAPGGAGGSGGREGAQVA